MAHGALRLSPVAPRSRFYQGPFGRICPDLDPWVPNGISSHDFNELENFFREIANEEMVEEPGKDKTPTEIAQDPELIQALENKFGSQNPAGYTYFGQFVDHDITFDPISSLMRQNDPNGLLNHRTPRLDLDSVYGKGPSASPHLYDRDDTGPRGQLQKLLTDPVSNDPNLKDLPRNSQGRAIIGDLRNDENAIVAQLQLAFILAHNTLVDRARDLELKNAFEHARTTLRWLYQHIVWNDFIPRITSDRIHNCALKLTKTCDGRRIWELGLKDVYHWKKQPFMPVEFSVAAYRFGHSMVRNSYQTNQPHRGFGNFVPIFDVNNPTGPNLRGFRPLVRENYIQWDWFLQMTTSGGPFPQRARKIDTKLSNALLHLHEGPVGSRENILALRNLLRGSTFNLPSGTSVARKLCIPEIDIPQDRDALWFYILREAEQLPEGHAGETLGRLGSTIVCAVFAGLLKGDPHSYFNLDPCWTPDEDRLLRAEDNVDDGNWTLASIIRLSGLPVSGADF